MKERPILFSAPMILALLAGRKTQTRRIVKPLRTTNGLPSGDGWKYAAGGGGWGGLSREENGGLSSWPLPRCPYGVPRDRLWVRETWAAADRMLTGYEKDDPVAVAYRADKACLVHEDAPPWKADTTAWNWDKLTWRPSIFMPRWASRITLEITGVKVERVAAISEEDARAEGIVSHEDGWTIPGDATVRFVWQTARDAFAALWEEINGKRPGCSWADNPWVFALTFRRLPDGR